MPEIHSPQDVSLYFEREGDNRFKLNSSQLELIGAQLRGRPRFSVFNSILLPLIVSVATVVFTGCFQYVSWINSVRLQNATDRVTKAAATYDRAASAIGKRYYASFLFVPSARDMINTSSTAENEIYKMQTALNRRRVDAYYDQIKLWNETYDQLITDIDYNLDRPLFLMAGQAREGNEVTMRKTKLIDCKKSLAEQLELVKLNRHSLKAQFAGIARCFVTALSTLNEAKDRSVADGNVKLDPNVAKEASARLDDVISMGNEFRCYALLRIDYFNSRKSEAIISPSSVWRWMNGEQTRSAVNHLKNADERCAINS
jgi:hypothetical protein